MKTKVYKINPKTGDSKLACVFGVNDKGEATVLEDPGVTDFKAEEGIVLDFMNVSPYTGVSPLDGEAFLRDLPGRLSLCTYVCAVFEE